MPRRPALAFIAKEAREMIPPTVFFAIGFNLIVLTGHLMVDDYGRQLFNFTIATTMALIVGKCVLLTNALPFLRRFDNAPLILPILFKTLVYASVVLVVRLLEALVEAWIADGNGIAAFHSVEARFAWNHFLAVQIWMIVLFLIYVTADELNTLFGDGALRQIFFTWSSPTLRSTRQQRMRALAAISRLARTQDAAVLRDTTTAANATLFGLLGALGQHARPPGAASLERPAPDPRPGGSLPPLLPVAPAAGSGGPG